MVTGSSGTLTTTHKVHDAITKKTTVWSRDGGFS
jgi:hypothetical protein